MLAELKELEAPLKQILYGCVEHVQATKAALYLPAAHDLTSKTYEVVTSYQFNDPARRVLTANDDLVDALAVKRTAFFVNGLGTDPRFAEMLFRQGNDRMLAVPLFSRGRIIGLLDMRDKAGKKLFEKSDLAAAAKIADEVLALLAEKSLFGLAAIKLVEEPAPPPAPRERPRPAGTPPPPPRPPEVEPPPAEGGAAPAAVLQLISEARERVSKAPAPQQKRRATPRDLEVFNLLLPAALAVRGAVVACITVVDASRVSHALAATAPVGDDVVDLVMGYLQRLLRRPSTAAAPRPQPLYPYGTQAAPVAASAITAMQSAAVSSRTVDGMALTIAFQGIAEADAQKLLQLFLQQMDPLITAAATATGDAVDRQAVAEKLLEPDFQKCPQLAEHSREVSLIVQRFATALELPPAQVEMLRIAGLVHDVGLRLLDYGETMYSNPNLTPDQGRIVAEHPIVGAAVIGPLLGAEIAHAVLRHHERIDGRGYPSRLPGNQIPFSSRVIQIVDAWVAMTSPSSYKATVTAEEAADRLREGAGTQFDESLVEKFLAALTAITTR